LQSLFTVGGSQYSIFCPVLVFSPLPLCTWFPPTTVQPVPPPVRAQDVFLPFLFPRSPVQGNFLPGEAPRSPAFLNRRTDTLSRPPLHLSPCAPVLSFFCSCPVHGRFERHHLVLSPLLKCKVAVSQLLLFSPSLPLHLPQVSRKAAQTLAQVSHTPTSPLCWPGHPPLPSNDSSRDQRHSHSFAWCPPSLS